MSSHSEILYQQVLRSLKGPSVPVHVRLAPESVLRATARALAQELEGKQASLQPVPVGGLVNRSAAKYD